MAEKSQDDIVIIGYAADTCLGDEKQTFDGLTSGRSALTNFRQPGGMLEDVPLEVTKAEVGGALPDSYDSLSDPAYRDSEGKILRKYRTVNNDRARATQIGASVAVRAVRHAGLFKQDGSQATLELDPEKIPDRRRIGVFMGTGIGGATLFAKASERVAMNRPVNPSITLGMDPSRMAAVISMEIGSNGLLATFNGACSAGNMAPVFGEWALRLNKADYMVVGGAEAPILPEMFAGYDGMKALDRETDPEKASRPFDITRSGFVPAEGGGAVVLTKRRFAEDIGATIYAEFIGSGVASDGHHDTEPNPEGRYAAYAMADAMAGVPEFLDGDNEAEGYVSAHGTSTPKGDAAELNGMRSVKELNPEKVHVSSKKAMMGHIIGGAAAAELVICVMIVSPDNTERLIVPSVHIEQPDLDIIGDWNLNIRQPRKGQSGVEPVRAPKVRWALNNSFGFGGHDYSTTVGAPR